jgi:hypothetical protein
MTVLPFLLLLLLTAPTMREGRPLFYWGARPAIVTLPPAKASAAASVVELRGARDGAELVLRFDLDRSVRKALYLEDGTPISGRLRAVLYIDADDDPATGFEGRADDFRKGADMRLDVGSVSIGADPEEKRGADAIVAATLYSLTREGRRRTLWRGDDEADPEHVSARGEWVEIRLPAWAVPDAPVARLILSTDSGFGAGRLTAR